jgi:AhpD family alkylhydroperoxidase
MTHAADRMTEVAALTKRLKAEFPNETKSFLNFFKEAENGPNLDAKHKELTNVALAVATQCEWCIAFHTRNAGKLGTTRAELIETGFQAVAMHGGPALMYMERLLDAVDTYAADTGAQ